MREGRYAAEKFLLGTLNNLVAEIRIEFASLDAVSVYLSIAS